MSTKINPFDILSGKVVRNQYGSVFYFKEAGANVNEGGWPTGILHREDGPAVRWSEKGKNEYHINGKHLTKKEFGDLIKKGNYASK